jgi:hypothetical protein
MFSAPSWSRLVPWAARLAWVAVAVSGTPALESVVQDRSFSVRITALILAAVFWLAGVAAVAIASTPTLTLARVIIPTVIPAGLLGILFGAEPVASIGTVIFALIATAVVATPEYGQIAVQSSAYGNEIRFPLRPPLGFLIAAVITWAVWVAATLSGALLLGSRTWVAGLILAAIALAVLILATPRWHRLSQRWLVLVPAGVVIHDPVTLSDTVMLKRSQIRHLTLAPADTEAYDLTGPAPGHAVEIAINETITVVCAPVGKAPPKAIHLTALLVAPSRPGRALQAAADRALLSR